MLVKFVYAVSAVGFLWADGVMLPDVSGQIMRAASGPPLGRLDELECLRQEEAAFRAAAERASRSVVRLEWVGGVTLLGQELLGGAVATGVVVAPQGWILTSSYFFVEKPATILVRFPDGQVLPGRLLGRDFNRMVTLVAVDRRCDSFLPEVCPASDIRVGMWTIAIGWTITDRPHIGVGILSAKNRIWGKGVQTDARTSPHNYGGPLADIRGRLVGVIVPFSPDGRDPVAGVEWHDSGIGFAVPFHDLEEVIPRLAQGVDLFPARCGIRFSHPNLLLAEPVIEAIEPGSPADKSGLRPRDRIIQAEGHMIRRASDFHAIVQQHYGGDNIRITIERDGKTAEVELTLAPDHQALTEVRKRDRQQAEKAD